ncbi:MAG: alpha/beta fold hydrolase [Bacteroidetes bacterium]|nr:alpha/beta fold hydrolase [Bacteroidota bacterium]
MQFKLIKEGGYEYIQDGEGPNLLLLHGLFGALSNWNTVLTALAPHYRVIIPLMPIYKNSMHSPSVEGLAEFVSQFVQYMKLTDLNLVGNSLGGHIALVYALREPGKVRTITLTGSSGLFESGMGTGYIPRGNYNFIKERVEYTFFKPETADKDLVDDVYETVNDAAKAIRIVRIARAAQRMNMRQEITQIQKPVCLIWGLNDPITPTYVAHEFNHLLPQGELHFLDEAGHAPMMEKPDEFNLILQDFLAHHNAVVPAHAG